MVADATDAIVSPFTGIVFTLANTSIAWQMQDVRMVWDVVTLDNGLQNSHAEHILGGENTSY